MNSRTEVDPSPSFPSVRILAIVVVVAIFEVLLVVAVVMFSVPPPRAEGSSGTSFRRIIGGPHITDPSNTNVAVVAYSIGEFVSPQCYEVVTGIAILPSKQ